MKYDVDYFIDKFSNIPEYLWSTGSVIPSESGAMCMLGHCGVVDDGEEYVHTEESEALFTVLGFELSEWVRAYSINDEYRRLRQMGPKESVLVALNRVKESNN